MCFTGVVRGGQFKGPKVKQRPNCMDRVSQGLFEEGKGGPRSSALEASVRASGVIPNILGHH